MFPPVKIATHAKTPVPFTKSCQWPILHFRSWENTAKTWRQAFAGRVPCNNWTLGLQHKWHSSFGKFRNFSNCRRRKPRHSVQNVFACVSKHYSQYRERMETAIFRNIYWAEFVQEHRNFRFTGIWDVSAEWGSLFCTVKTTCWKDAGLSAARWGMPTFPHLSCMIFPQLKVFQKWFNSAVVFMLQMFFFYLCANQSELAKFVLRPVVSQGFGVASSFLTVKRKSHIINYLLTSLARSVRRKYQTSVCTDQAERSDIFFVETLRSVNKKLITKPHTEWKR